ncbi:MAG: hypothetical protein ISS28_01920 [Candidatus Cloacimonetes bacterium]|nr:hypothetical protein [Candidatus Cloacimonadota bacterium]MBL7085845.1 hypothetical protein [Candidatus Cloacimonadota bacterium]
MSILLYQFQSCSHNFLVPYLVKVLIILGGCKEKDKYHPPDGESASYFLNAS